MRNDREAQKVIAWLSRYSNKLSRVEISPNDLLRTVFGPHSWAQRCARAFGCTQFHAWHLAEGHRPLTRRQLVMVVTIAKQRPSNLRAEKRRELARVEREYETLAREMDRIARYAAEMAEKLR